MRPRPAVGEQTTLADRKRRAGQRLVVGFDGPVASDDLRRLCRLTTPAGFILFGRNVEEPAQVAELGRELDALCDPHLPGLVCIDQEGGAVLRLRETAWPPARALGERDQPELTREVARAMGAELRAVGVHVDLAPVADLGRGGGTREDRAFADAPEAVARHVAAFVRGLHDAGVVACPKHFPGQGAADGDAHEVLPTLDRDPGDLDRAELVPFRSALAAGAAAVMAGHVRVPAWDERHPASQSAAAVRDRLRGDLGFGGVVISDDLEMRAVLGRWPLDEQLDRACRATVDLFIVGSSVEAAAAAWEALIHLQESDPRHDDLATDSEKRVARLRLRARRPGGARPGLEVVGSLEHRMLARMAAS